MVTSCCTLCILLTHNSEVNDAFLISPRYAKISQDLPSRPAHWRHTQLCRVRSPHSGPRAFSLAGCSGALSGSGWPWLGRVGCGEVLSKTPLRRVLCRECRELLPSVGSVFCRWGPLSVWLGCLERSHAISDLVPSGQTSPPWHRERGTPSPTMNREGKYCLPKGRRHRRLCGRQNVVRTDTGTYSHREPCGHWKVRTAHRYHGPREYQQISKNHTVSASSSPQIILVLTSKSSLTGGEFY